MYSSEVPRTLAITPVRALSIFVLNQESHLDSANKSVLMKDLFC